MPWVIKKTGSKWCVHKKGEGGKPKGESLGCHETRAEAIEQMQALYVHEEKAIGNLELKIKKLYEGAGLDWGEDQTTFSAMKMYYDEQPMTNFYVPYGITSIADAMAAMEAKKEVAEIGHMVNLFQQVIDNIAYDAEVDDKRGAISKAAKELASMIEGELKDDDKPEKSFKAEHMTGTAQDHKHEIMDDTTSSSAGHKHKVKDGKIQMADGHTHSMPEKEDKKAIDPSDYLTVKSIGANRVGCYAVLWGDETRKDLTGEWFSPKTEELTAIYDAVGKLPYLYHHGMDESLKTTVIGIVDTLKADSIGLWYEAQLKLASEYEEYVNKLLADKKLKTSTQ
ncbi:MAG TPA: hypothetical protein VJ044_11345, partial [Candidatus Hodarchaeales archaeon]|nr:hypothetical protein [Candidatus Hodarchaeales archaeon]